MLARQGRGDQPRPHGSHPGPRRWPNPHGHYAGPSEPDTPAPQPDGAQRTGHAPAAGRRVPGYRPRPMELKRTQNLAYRPPTDIPGDFRSNDVTSRSLPVIPIRLLPGVQRTGHAPTAARRCSGEWPRPHCGQPNLRDQPYRTAARHNPGDRSHPRGNQTGPRGVATPPQRPDRPQGTDHAPTATTWGPGDRPYPQDQPPMAWGPDRPHGGHHGPGDRSRPNGSQTGHRRPATAAQLPPGTQQTGTAPTVANEVQGTGHTPMAVTRDLSHPPRPHSGQTGCSGPVTPPRQPGGAQGTGHSPMAARRGPGDRPRPAGPWGPATPPCDRTRPRDRPRRTAPRHIPGERLRPRSNLTGPRGPTTPPRRPRGMQGTGHTPTAATCGQ